MPSINAEHPFCVIQTGFIFPEKAVFTSVSKNDLFQRRSRSFDWITAGKVAISEFSITRRLLLVPFTSVYVIPALKKLFD
jgi:hypothetical protein